MTTLKETLYPIIRQLVREALEEQMKQLELSGLHAGQVAKLETLLKQHDWHYEYSDDPRSYREGLRSARAIEELAKTLPQEEVEALLIKYKPKVH